MKSPISNLQLPSEGQPNFTPAKAAIAPTTGELAADMQPAGVNPISTPDAAPESVDDAEARANEATWRIIGESFMRTVRREQEKQQPTQPEAPVIDV